ncbi:MAG: HAD family hydrolase [Dehalococcoidia bacterium]
MNLKIVSLDMDGTLVDSGFVTSVWHSGIPRLYAEKQGIGFEEAKRYVLAEYEKVGESAVEWYDIKFWLRHFHLDGSWQGLLAQFEGELRAYPEVRESLHQLSERFTLVLSSNAAREFLDTEVGKCQLQPYFKHTFSATSDFGLVKKTPEFYLGVCRALSIEPGELAHIGDHWDFDYLVPKSLGIRALYLDRSGQKKADFTITDLSQVAAKLLP